MGPSLIGRLRLYHQRVTHTAFEDAGAVAAWLGALQGQDYIGTKWALGLRWPGSTEADIDRAIDSGRVMRTWGPRGTLHDVAPADIHWIVALIAPRQIAGNTRRYGELGLDEATLTRSTDLIAEALQGGAQLTRSELFDMLEANGIAAGSQRGFYMLQRAGLERVVYQGAMRGKETTFLALPPGDALPPDVAQAELARRYFTSRGPATLADFAHWSGLLTSEARAGLESVRAELVEEVIDGRTYFLSPDTAEPPQRALYLLPGFDEFVLGYKDRSAVLDSAFADAICPGGNGVFMPTIVSAGRIIGIWKRALKKKTVEITLEPFRPFTAAEQDALHEAAAGFGAFVGLTASLTM